MNSNMIAFQGLIKLDNIYTLFIYYTTIWEILVHCRPLNSARLLQNCSIEL